MQWRHLACTVAEAFELVQWDVSVITPKRAWRNGRPRWNRGGINIRFHWIPGVIFCRPGCCEHSECANYASGCRRFTVCANELYWTNTVTISPTCLFFFCKDWTVETRWTLEISWHRCNTHGGYTEKKSKKEWMKLHSIFDHMSLRYLVATSDRQSWFILLAELLLYSGCLWIRFVQAYRLQH